MRFILVLSVLACLALPAAAQTPKTIVNCWIVNGHVNYGQLGKLLPDSIAATLLVDVHKKLNTYDDNLTLVWLEQQGWKLLAVDVTTFYLSKEINLDEAARSIFIQKLENLHKK